MRPRPSLQERSCWLSSSLLQPGQHFLRIRRRSFPKYSPPRRQKFRCLVSNAARSCERSLCSRSNGPVCRREPCSKQLFHCPFMLTKELPCPQGPDYESSSAL